MISSAAVPLEYSGGGTPNCSAIAQLSMNFSQCVPEFLPVIISPSTCRYCIGKKFARSARSTRSDELHMLPSTGTIRQRTVHQEPVEYRRRNRATRSNKAKQQKSGLVQMANNGKPIRN